MNIRDISILIDMFRRVSEENEIIYQKLINGRLNADALCDPTNRYHLSYHLTRGAASSSKKFQEIYANSFLFKALCNIFCLNNVEYKRHGLYYSFAPRPFFRGRAFIAVLSNYYNVICSHVEGNNPYFNHYCHNMVNPIRRMTKEEVAACDLLGIHNIINLTTGDVGIYMRSVAEKWQRENEY